MNTQSLLTDRMAESQSLQTLAIRRTWWDVAVRRGLVWPFFLAVLAIAIAPQLPIPFQLKAALWLSFGIVALSLDFVWGKAGIFSFGHTVLFGIGAYAYAIASVNLFPVTHETGSALLIAMLASATFAGVLGAILFYGRIGEVYLAIVTIAVTLVFYTVVSSTAGPEYQIGEALLGGFNGIPSLPSIAIGLPGSDTTSEMGPTGLLAFAAACAAAAYALLKFLSSGAFGQALAGLRENEQRMDLLGYDTCRLKLVAYIVGGAVAGLGGALFAAWGTFVNPSVFSLSQAALVVIWVMVGGRGTLVGAFVGVVLVQWIADEAEKVISQQTPLILGLLLIIVVMVAPSGIVPRLRSLLDRILQIRPRAVEPASQTTDTGSKVVQLARRPLLPPINEVPQPNRTGEAADFGIASASLTASGITKSFGGLEVLRGITIEFVGPGVHVVIGANGAGKSTFFGVLTGRHRANDGRIALGDCDLSRLPTWRRARQGVGMKMQVASVFQDLTVRDNLELAQRASRSHHSSDLTQEILAAVGLDRRLESQVSSLAHGEQQWLEIAMVLAQNPPVILLDEPAAGMTRAERHRSAELIKRLGANHTVIVVEHDMAFIRSLEAPISMLHQGMIFRQGRFDEIAADPEVIDVYLGRQHVA